MQIVDNQFKGKNKLVGGRWLLSGTAVFLETIGNRRLDLSTYRLAKNG